MIRTIKKLQRRLYYIIIYPLEPATESKRFSVFLHYRLCDLTIGNFIAFYGKRAFQKALFPMLFLIFMIPIPFILLDPIIRILQVGSAQAVDGIFQIIGIPYYRDGMVFEFTGVTIEVAKQCSGIRSSLAMLITSVVAGYLILPSGWRRVVLIPVVVPITIFKNAVRITTITLLSIYVDEKFLTDSWLHHSRGDRLFCNRAGAACVGYLGFEMAPEKGIKTKSFTDGCRKDSVIEKSEV